MGQTVERLIEGIPHLGSYSGILQEIEAVLNDPQSTLVEVGEIIEKDPDVTARLLRLANSSFFGFPTRLESVPDAISLIGVQQVQDLICASSVVDIFEGISPTQVNMKLFWQHSLACGVATRLLALHQRLPKPEKYFVCGLLHDVGRLVLFSRAPATVREIFHCYQSQPMLLRQAEAQVLGFDHAEVGAALMRAWNFPPMLVHGVCFHHAPMVATAFQREAALVHLADYVVNALELGCSGERLVPPLQAGAALRLNVTPEMLDSFIDAIENQMQAVEQAFLGS